MEQVTLKPCPFCGSENVHLLPPTRIKETPYHPGDRACPVVICGGCYAQVVGEDWEESGKTAVANWNNRAH